MNKSENDDDSEYEEEESLVVVELTGIMEADLLPKVQECKVLGIDTDKPLLQIDHYAFQGEYQDALGTCLLFEEKSVPNTDGGGDRPPEKELEFKHLTNRKLCMQRVFIKKKDPNGETLLSEDGEKTSEQMEVDAGASSMFTFVTASTQLDTGSERQPGTSQCSVDSTGSSSQAGSEYEAVTFDSDSGTIHQTGSNSLQPNSLQSSTSSVYHSRTEQEVSSSSASEPHLSEAKNRGTGIIDQNFTIEVYTGMETEDSDNVTETEANLGVSDTPGVLDTHASESKDERTFSDKPNG